MHQTRMYQEYFLFFSNIPQTLDLSSTLKLENVSILYCSWKFFVAAPQMPQLEKKLKEELESNARIIACRFPFPCWIPDHTTGEGIDTVWAYDLKSPRESESKSLETTPAAES